MKWQLQNFLFQEVIEDVEAIVAAVAAAPEAPGEEPQKEVVRLQNEVLKNLDKQAIMLQQKS